MNNPTPKPPEVNFFGLTPPSAPPFPTHQVYSNERRLLTPPECRALIEAGDTVGWKPGTIGNAGDGNSVEDPSYRCVQLALLYPSHKDKTGQDLKWFFAKLAERVVWANQAYGFHLSGFCEAVQLLRYEAAPEGGQPGHYKQHQDFGGGLSALRKLSCVVQLSHHDEYDGCRLHLVTHEDREVVETCQGDLVVFPSWTPHYVTPITRGVRYAIAAWVGGPRFV